MTKSSGRAFEDEQEAPPGPRAAAPRPPPTKRDERLCQRECNHQGTSKQTQTYFRSSLLSNRKYGNEYGFTGYRN